MYQNNTLTYLLLFALLLLFTPKNMFACEGSLNPPCSRSIFLAKFAPATVVIPSSGPINVPVGLLPFVTWDNTNNNCAQPSTATLTLTLNCTPVGGGTTTVVGPVNIPIQVPVTPGPQPLGAPAIVTIPAGTIAGTTPQVCLVVGTYSVTFSGGSIGSGTISGTGDTEVCLVEPSPIDPTKPRLDVSFIPEDNEEYLACRRGDQGTAFFGIFNNDPNESVSLELTSEGRQIAGLPDGISIDDAVNKNVRAISSIVPGTDTFPAAFADELTIGELLHGDPMQADPMKISRNIILGPGESTIIGITMRSYAMCADGSCNERNFNLIGEFSDGTPALGCGSTVFIVDEAAPKTVLCEFRDEIKVAPNVDAIWGGAIFQGENLHHANTHTIGNSEDLFGFEGRGNLTRGLNFNEPDWPPMSTDYMRTEYQADQVSWNVLFYAEPLQFFPLVNNYTVTGLPSTVDEASGLTNEFPLISFQTPGPDPIDILHDIQTDDISVSVAGETAYSGNFADFLGDAENLGFFVDIQTCRRISKVEDLTDFTILTDKASLPVLLRDNGNFLLSKTNEFEKDTIYVFDQNGNPIAWSASYRGYGVALESNAGSAGMPIVVMYNTDNVKAIPEKNLAFIDITSPNALNSPKVVPVSIRLDTTAVVGVTADNSLIPNNTELKQNYPNPFNPSTVISYSIAKSSHVTLKIYDVLGKEVRVLVNEGVEPGNYQVTLDAQHLSSGIYFYQLEAGNKIETRKMMLMK